MAHKLGDEIGKTGPFQSLEQEALLNCMRTADRLAGSLTEVLKPSQLSATQYNVLRILQGSWPQGLACREVARRMITRDADLTRVLDRLETRGLIQRQRQTDDRRVVHTLIIEAGKNLLAEVGPALASKEQQLLGHLGGDRLSMLIELLETARERTME